MKAFRGLRTCGRNAAAGRLRRACIAALALAFVGAAGSASAADDIVIGAALPLTGPLAGFGGFQQWGYKHAVAKVNAAGGITIDGVRRKVKLIILDDQTNPNVTAHDIDTLISRDHAVAVLGSCTPALVNAGALAAERRHIPMVAGCDPLEAFKSVRHWKWVWDIFFDEPDLAAAPFQTMEAWKTQTNKKIAIFHDNGPDGIGLGEHAWPAFAKKYGYDIVVNESFPIDNTVFTSVINKAKHSGADIALVDSLTPQAVAIRKQMKEAGWTPKVLVIEKGGEPLQFATALGPLADGVMVGGYWDPSFPFPGAAELRTQFEKETGRTFSQHIADSAAAAEILLDGIARAASTDPAKINEALGKTDKTYVVGPVKFDANHTSALPIAELQWQSGKTIVVWPRNRATGKFLFPVPN